MKYNIDLKYLIEQETGQKFDRNGKICCPFHNEKTPSFSVKNDRFTCFGGCEARGDVIDFIRQYKGYNYVQAIKYLGIDSNTDRSQFEKDYDKIKNMSDWLVDNHDRIKDKNYKLEAIYPYKNQDGKVLYYKVKFKSNNKKYKKEMFYMNIDDTGKVKLSRGEHKEIPYNLYNLSNALLSKKPIFIVEGEKDVETMKTLGYTATSLKNVNIKDFDFSIFNYSTTYIIPDTGEAGKTYVYKIWDILKDFVNEFNIIDLKGIDKLGDNKDITDWIEAGYDIKDFKNSMSLSWDWKKSTKWKYVESIIKNGEFQGYKPIKVWENLDLLLKRNNIEIRMNKLNRRIEQNYSIEENSFYEDIYTLSQMNGLKLTIDEVQRFCLRISKMNEFSPVEDYLNKCYENYNGKDYLKQFYDTIVCTDDFDNKTKELYLNKMLLNSIHIAFNDGNRNSEGILVLQGGQGIGKTRWTRKLSPIEKTVKTGQVINPDSKDKVLEITSYWYTEIGELESTLKGDLAKLKAFITEEVDELRRPYSRASERFPRKTTFIATVNSEDFLKDETGNRRYWVVPIKEIRHDLMDKIDIDQLYGQVMYIYNKGETKHYFDDVELNALYDSNKKFNYKNSIQLILEDLFQDGEESVFTLTEIKDNWLKNEKPKAIANTLKAMGYERKNQRVNGVLKNGYKLPISKLYIEFSEIRAI